MKLTHALPATLWVLTGIGVQAQTRAPGLWEHRVTMTSQATGIPQQMTMTMAGKWLGAECGDVKPVGARPGR